MKKLIITTIAVASLALSMAANAITIGANQLLGIIEPGTPANPANEQMMVNGLLEGWGSVAGYNDGAPSGTVMGDNPADQPPAEVYTLRYSVATVIPAAGSAPLAQFPSVSVVTGNTTVNLGDYSYDWVLAKWGQDSAVYYIKDLTGLITLSLDGTGWSSQGHGLSGYSLFNVTKKVPDGGTTALLMGIGLMGLGFLKRRLS